MRYTLTEYMYYIYSRANLWFLFTFRRTSVVAKCVLWWVYIVFLCVFPTNICSGTKKYHSVSRSSTIILDLKFNTRWPLHFTISNFQYSRREYQEKLRQVPVTYIKLHKGGLAKKCKSEHNFKLNFDYFW